MPPRFAPPARVREAIKACPTPRKRSGTVHGYGRARCEAACAKVWFAWGVAQTCSRRRAVRCRHCRCGGAPSRWSARTGTTSMRCGGAAVLLLQPVAPAEDQRDRPVGKPPDRGRDPALRRDNPRSAVRRSRPAPARLESGLISPRTWIGRRHSLSDMVIRKREGERGPGTSRAPCGAGFARASCPCGLRPPRVREAIKACPTPRKRSGTVKHRLRAPRPPHAPR